MSFGGLEFLLVFLPAAWAIYWLAPKRAAIQNAILLAISWAFYASWNPKLLGILLLTTAVNYLAVRTIDGLHNKDARKKRMIFWAAVAYNGLQLLGFKYAGFFADSLDTLLGTDLPSLRFVLPLGISFWTLQLIAYLTDVYFARVEVERRPVRFALFVAFFPQIVSGPIPRGRELLPQFAAERRFTWDDLRVGGGTFFLGYVLKFFVGDALAEHLVNPIFADPGAYSMIGHWLGLVGYCGQVFGDFAGYSIMAIGCGRFFGIEVPVNFNYPFFSRDMMEFWRRWHITLNTWLFDYMYAGLVTSKGWFRRRLDLGFLLVFAFSGLWHGATWAFVLWGVIHGVGLIVHRRWDEQYRNLCRKDRKWVKRRKTAGYAVFAWTATQLFFLLSLVPFRSPDIGASAEYFRAMVWSSGLHHPLGGNPIGAIAATAALGFIVAYHLLEVKRLQPWRARFFALPAPVRGLCYGLAIVFLAMFMPVGSGTFIYAQF